MFKYLSLFVGVSRNEVRFTELKADGETEEKVVANDVLTRFRKFDLQRDGTAAKLPGAKYTFDLLLESTRIFSKNYK